jgi:alkylation response protein AidB-like acyl-CoA dehydrogenase
MNFTLSSDHEALRDAARTFLSKEVRLSELLAPGATLADAAYDRIWKGMVDLGWPAMAIPEQYGGLGMSMIDLAMVVGEAGRHLAPAPLFGTLAGAWAVERTGSEAQKKAILGAVAEGKMKLALAVSDADGNVDGPDSDAIAEGSGSAWTVSGSKSFVVDGSAADQLVVAAKAGSVRKFFLVDRRSQGVQVERVDWRDISRQVCTVKFSAAPAQLLAESDDSSWPWIRDRLYLVLAAESAAGMEKAFDDTVAYAKERVAFGKPIGAFQTIKHQLAELVGMTASSTAAVHYAAWALTEQAPRATLAAAMAQAYASDAYREVTHRNIQIFGAIGFTWEMHNHIYYKRARANAELLGAPRVQREQVMRLLEAHPELIES